MMSLKQATLSVLPRGLHASREIRDLASPLNAIGIDSISYSVFDCSKEDRTVRLSTYSSDENLINYYIEKLVSIPESALLEKQNFPINKSGLFCPYNPSYSTDYSARQLEHNYGIKNALAFSLHDVTSKKTELFWFQTLSDQKEWFIQQIQNLKILNQFIMYFKDQMPKNIKQKQLTTKEIQELYHSPKKIHTETEHLNSNNTKEKINFNINNYYLGFPFHQPLSKKEFLILKETFLGYTAKEIARQFNISVRTVEKQLERILEKTYCLNLKKLRQELFSCKLFCNAVLSHI